MIKNASVGAALLVKLPNNSVLFASLVNFTLQSLHTSTLSHRSSMEPAATNKSSETAAVQRAVWPYVFGARCYGPDPNRPEPPRNLADPRPAGRQLSPTRDPRVGNFRRPATRGSPDFKAPSRPVCPVCASEDSICGGGTLNHVASAGLNCPHSPKSIPC